MLFTHHTNYKTGKFIESLASLFLSLKGYKILQKRYKTKFGEIDLLASKAHTLIAIEVKYRSDQESLPYVISPKQQARIRRALEYAHKKYPNYVNLRCDTLLISPYKWPIHIKNAF